MSASERKPLIWVGSTRKDLQAFPSRVQREVGYALHIAQIGGRHPDAKALKGFGGGAVLEVVQDDDGDTFRAVYTVRLAGRVYALHVFQKKSKRGISTPKKELDTIRQRLREATEIHKNWLEEQQAGGQS
jgi:phage-related protein